MVSENTTGAAQPPKPENTTSGGEETLREIADKAFIETPRPAEAEELVINIDELVLGSDLVEENATLRAALKPFAEMGQLFRDRYGDRGMDADRVTPNMAPALLQAAKVWQELDIPGVEAAEAAHADGVSI